MSDLPLKIREMPTGFVIDDGTYLLDACPCCDLRFKTIEAARQVLASIEFGTWSMKDAVTIVRHFREVQARLQERDG